MIINSISKFLFGFITRRNYSHQLKLVIKNRQQMNKAYYHYKDGADQFQLSFILTNPQEAGRQFNFSRSKNENIETLIKRITTNVEKLVNKKRKKREKLDTSFEREEKPLNIKIISRGSDVSNESCCIDVFNNGSDTRLHILEEIFEVVINAPWITSLQLPDTFLALYPVYPKKFEGIFLSKEKSRFEWFASENCGKNPTAKWNKVGEGFMYFPSNEDIGRHLKLVCYPGNNSLMGPEAEVISKCVVEAGPGFCPFEARHTFTPTKLSGNDFRVMCYNLLADLYSDSDFSRTVLFPYCPPYALHMDYRKQLIMKEIVGFNSDIICLQEVDCKIFDLDLSPVLDVQGYDKVFSKKKGQVAEGVACFFRSERFRLIDSESCILSDELSTSPALEDIWSCIKSNESFVNRITNRSTVLQICVLESRDNTNEVIIIGNTHLYFHPDADHVRLTQAGIIILKLNSIVQKYQKLMPDKRVSLILCGDFNTVPSCGIYQLFTTGIAPSDLVDWKSNEAEAVSDLTLKQPLLLGSACGTPQFTNFTTGFADCLDYIFYHKSNLDVLQVVPFPSVEELNQHTALPSIVFPSDHISLVADLKFK